MYLNLQQATFDYERLQYNTVVSSGMKMLNSIEDAGEISAPVRLEAMQILLHTLYPVVPHITVTLWNELGFAKRLGDLLDCPWQAIDPQALVQEEIELMLQINGKLRGSMVVASNADNATIETLARAHEKVKEFGEGREPKKVIVVKGKLVNVVV
ncbi:unnamed protein product [Darwinula stevensoni]|uniref:leucine--tRNA ligase n=1 Tax=Darwinula stevensoni TaxID=69355 RepID=A0A7R9AEM6_9CRUS|nr:unnamed protein product [Darwinula stevensoni]CAG0902445.1 unnamed protein product [Darwinula stevensoni]